MVGYSPKLRFHAVSVIPDAHGCAAAQALRNIRMLSADAPRLPLANCDHPATCGCKFQHHADRRAGPRRNSETTASGIRHVHLPERRDRRGRRDSDFDY